MYGRSGLDRFKKAQSLEPFSVSANSGNKTAAQPVFKEPAPRGAASASTHQAQALYAQRQYVNNQNVVQKIEKQDVAPAPAQQVTQFGGGQSTWQPPDWAIEPRPGVYYLDVIKDGEVLDKINLDKRRHIFGRQFHACDFVLDHQSVSRQHAAVVPHKNGSVYVIDLGSAHGTFVANERLTKDSPVELEVGQSLRFAASTRTYILRKNEAALLPPTPKPSEIELPPLPDPSDEEAVLAYNTYINRALNGFPRPDITSKSSESSSLSGAKDDNRNRERPSKRIRRSRVAFKDQMGGVLVEVVGFSDGADVETEPGPIGVKEGSLVGKYESLVQVTVIPKGKEQTHTKDGTMPHTGVTEKLQQVLNKVKTPAKTGGIYDDLYGESFSDKVGSTWAYKSSGVRETSPSTNGGNSPRVLRDKSDNNSGNNDDDDDDLFG